MTAVTARVPLHPTLWDGGHPSLHIDPGITLPPVLLGLADGVLSPRQQQLVGVISETDRLTDAVRSLGTGLSGLSASVRSIAVRPGLARPTELVTLARRHAVLDAASEAICGLDEDITDSSPVAEERRRAAALEMPGRLAGGTDREINEPAKFILDNPAFLANIWGPTARAWSCHCRT